MRSGQLRQALVIQRATETRDTYGQAVTTWSKFVEVYGSLQPISGRERVLSAQTVAEATYRARIRWLDGLTEKMRIRFGERYFNIVYVADDGRRRELVLDLIEGIEHG